MDATYLAARLAAGEGQDVVVEMLDQFVDVRHEPPLASDGKVPREPLASAMELETAALLAGILDYRRTISAEASGSVVITRSRTQGNLADGTVVDVESRVDYSVVDGKIVGLTVTTSSEARVVLGAALRAGGMQIPSRDP